MKIKLSKKVIEKMNNEQLSEILLGITDRPKTTRLKHYRWKIFAICLWLSTYYLASKLGLPSGHYRQADPALKLLGVSTLGLLIVVFANWLSSYKGPAYLLGGRFFQKIDRTSPLVTLIFLGWALLIICFVVLLVSSFNKV